MVDYRYKSELFLMFYSYDDVINTKLINMVENL